MSDTPEPTSNMIPAWEYKIEELMQVGIQFLRLFFPGRRVLLAP